MRTQDAVHRAWSAPTTEYWAPTGTVRVLNPSLSMRERMLVVLYNSYPDPILEGDLVRSIEHSNASVFRRDVLRPAHKKAQVHYDTDERLVYLSPLGVREVEDEIDLQV